MDILKNLKDELDNLHNEHKRGSKEFVTRRDELLRAIEEEKRARKNEKKRKKTGWW